jgi:hypothetical protein
MPLCSPSAVAMQVGAAGGGTSDAVAAGAAACVSAAGGAAGLSVMAVSFFAQANNDTKMNTAGAIARGFLIVQLLNFGSYQDSAIQRQRQAAPLAGA